MLLCLCTYVVTTFFFLLFCKYWYRNRHTSTDSREGLSAAAASMADMFYTHSMEFFFLILLPLSFSLCVLLSMFWFAYFSSVSFDFVCVKKTGFHGICLNFFFFSFRNPSKLFQFVFFLHSVDGWFQFRCCVFLVLEYTHSYMGM